MDTQTSVGREQTTTPCGEQGSAGGPVSTGGDKVHDGEPAAVSLKDTVYLRWNGALLRCVVQAFHDFHNAIVVANGNGECVCTRDDLLTETEHAAAVFAEGQRKSATENSRVLSAYPLIPATIVKSDKRNEWLASYCEITPRKAAGAVRSLAHWKLIELPSKEIKDEQPTD